MDWNDLKYFLALSRTGSVRAAGASLRVSHSTVLRRVQALEEELGARLFDRSRAGFTLTLAGHELVATAQVMESNLAQVQRSLSGRDERFAGPVVLTCCDVYISDLLIGELTPFCAEYPEIELAVINDSRAFDLSKREADIAVRALARGQAPPEHLIGRRLAPVTVCSYVGVDHPERDPETPGDTRWIAFEDRKVFSQILQGSRYEALPQWGSVSSLPLAVQMTRAGMGICKLPTYVGEWEGSRLRRLDHPERMHVGDLWLLSHTDLRDNARLRETRRHIVAAFEAHLPLFEGTHPCGA